MDYILKDASIQFMNLKTLTLRERLANRTDVCRIIEYEIRLSLLHCAALGKKIE